MDLENTMQHTYVSCFSHLSIYIQASYTFFFFLAFTNTLTGCQTYCSFQNIKTCTPRNNNQNKISNILTTATRSHTRTMQRFSPSRGEVRQYIQGSFRGQDLLPPPRQHESHVSLAGESNKALRVPNSHLLRSITEAAQMHRMRSCSGQHRWPKHDRSCTFPEVRVLKSRRLRKNSFRTSHTQPFHPSLFFVGLEVQGPKNLN